MDRSTVDNERAWRLQQWAEVAARQEASDFLSAQEVRERGIYGGAGGIHRDLEVTTNLEPHHGITVSVLHTGQHYDDQLAADGVLYNYPATERAGRDVAEVAATKATNELELPIFVVTKDAPGTKRRLHLGWVVDWSDLDQQFVITFDETPPDDLAREPDVPQDAPFSLTDEQQSTASTVNRIAGREVFRQNVLARYGAQCALTDLQVPEMLEAAHLRDVKHQGTNDPRNGIPLSAALHRAFDRHLFTIDPDTLEVVTAPDGPSAEQMGISRLRLEVNPLPRPEALRWRYEAFRGHWS